MSLLRAPLPERLTPLAAEFGVMPLYGDIHNHCDLSYGDGRFEDALARAALQLDFVSITGHAHWPDMPVDDARVAHIVAFHIEGFARLKARWPGHFGALAAASGPGFVVFSRLRLFPAAYGDYTIVYRDVEPAPMILADSPAELRARLESVDAGSRLRLSPSHRLSPRRARGELGCVRSALSPFVEMNSMHGCAEASADSQAHPAFDGADRRAQNDAGGPGARPRLRRRRQHRSSFGVSGSSYGHGRMAVYAKARDRDAIWR